MCTYLSVVCMTSCIKFKEDYFLTSSFLDPNPGAHLGATKLETIGTGPV